MSPEVYRHGQPMAIGINERAAIPVFFDLHSANRNDEPPVTLFTGKPGSGKTFSILWTLSLAALQGAAVVGIDWKGDLLKILNIEEVLGVPTNVKTIDATKEENIGILDPFVIFDNHDNEKEAAADIQTAVNALIHALMPGALADGEIKPWVAATISDVIKAYPKEKSMNVFFNMLLDVASANGNQKLKGFALSLQNTLNEGAGVILCAEPDRKPARYFDFTPGATVIDLSRLHELPKTVEDLNDPSKAVGQAILTMVTLLVRQSMLRMPKNIKKVLAIDEAWAILGNESGMSLVKSTSKLGRSMNLAVILGSQSYKDVFNNTTGLDTSLASTHFAFANSRQDAEIGALAMGLQGDDAEQVISAITRLQQGHCIMQDIRKRRGHVRMIVWLEELVKAFSTNPFDETHQQQEI